MNSIEKYLARQTFVPPIFEVPTVSNIGIVITIPSYAEPNLISALDSLLNCEMPPVGVEVVVAINHPVSADDNLKDINQKSYEEAITWAKEHSNAEIQFLITSPLALPKKHAGAGLARKVAMDEAVNRLQSSDFENPIISAFDGDATCTKNYLVELWQHFQENPKSLGCSINFEHPIDAIKEGELAEFQIDSITQYELHLRYYQAALVYAKHPQAEFTVGSSMAVTRNAYVAQGGMNRRKAGEDFWFMLKLMMAGSITAITDATVFPSARESFRVPFGTGRAMTEMSEKGDSTFYTASLDSFIRLKEFLLLTNDLYEGEVEIKDELTLQFLESTDWLNALAEIRLYTTDLPSFVKRFYRWFNIFMVMKYFHFLRDNGVADVPVKQAGNDLYIKGFGVESSNLSTTDLLKKLRAKKRVKPSDFTL
jgi:cellulose synthase/poly-beta-1,6-N-acetylglucosamine synthase-like glycosyltransferase